MSHYIEQRPWGQYEILSQFSVSEPGFSDVCVKKMTIKPGQRVSYQSHKLRNEHWFFVQGKGVVVQNDREIPVQVGSSVDIKIGDKHRVENTDKETDLIFIESQTGHYDEQDIERYSDDYGRVGK
ncbi:MAG: phosphomannose isomerase type II C-terminal cupin domain [Patescibacteria group bacterium]|nr:phosphomannose isomerase type II C-terminal cupin domain [Patescibacteria group bacterium]